MSGLDGALIEETTAGMKRPNDGDQNAVVRVDDAVAPEAPNLRYQTLAAFAAEVAPLLGVPETTESPDGSVAVGGGFGVEVELTFADGYVYEVRASALAEDGAGGVEFYEVRRGIISRAGGSSVIVLQEVISTNADPNWELALSGGAGTPGVTAVALNYSANDRGCSVSVGIVQARKLPASPA